MSTTIFSDPIEVANKVSSDFGLLVEQFIAAARHGHGRRNMCTDNHPTGARSYILWAETVAALRENCCSESTGWERNNDGGISFIIHKERKIKIAVCNTDDATGLAIEGRSPQNRSKKGSATESAVFANQGEFEQLLREINVVQLDPQNAHEDFVYWVLCIHVAGDRLRVELSCPIAIENGVFKEFHERILLTFEDGDDGMVRKQPASPDVISEFDVDIQRKRA